MSSCLPIRASSVARSAVNALNTCVSLLMSMTQASSSGVSYCGLSRRKAASAADVAAEKTCLNGLRFSYRKVRAAICYTIHKIV